MQFVFYINSVKNYNCNSLTRIAQNTFINFWQVKGLLAHLFQNILNIIIYTRHTVFISVEIWNHLVMFQITSVL